MSESLVWMLIMSVLLIMAGILTLVTRRWEPFLGGLAAWLLIGALLLLFRWMERPRRNP